MKPPANNPTLVELAQAAEKLPPVDSHPDYWCRVTIQRAGKPVALTFIKFKPPAHDRAEWCWQGFLR